VKSIVALHGDYSTAEPFVDWDFDYRIQKIGCHVRAYRRQVSQATQWKGNVGNAMIEEIDVEPRWLRWANAAAGCYGGLDILALDLVRNRVTGEEFILEVLHAPSLITTRCATTNLR
jgi:synapsin